MSDAESAPDIEPLSLEESTWAQRTLRRLMAGTEACEQPEAVFVVGQPGAGKSVIVEEACRFFHDRGSAVVLDLGDLYCLHPGHTLLEEDPDAATEAVLRAQAAELAAIVAIRAVEEQRNVVLELPPDGPDALTQAIRGFDQAGYFLTVLFLHTDPDTSWNDLAECEAHTRDRVGAGRAISSREHDDSYAALLPALCAVEEQGLVHELHVIERGGRVLASVTDAEDLAASVASDALAAVFIEGVGGDAEDVTQPEEAQAAAEEPEQHDSEPEPTDTAEDTHQPGQAEETPRAEESPPVAEEEQPRPAKRVVSGKGFKVQDFSRGAAKKRATPKRVSGQPTKKPAGGGFKIGDFSRSEAKKETPQAEPDTSVTEAASRDGFKMGDFSKSAANEPAASEQVAPAESPKSSSGGFKVQGFEKPSDRPRPQRRPRKPEPDRRDARSSRPPPEHRTQRRRPAPRARPPARREEAALPVRREEALPVRHDPHRDDDPAVARRRALQQKIRRLAFGEDDG